MKKNQQKIQIILVSVGLFLILITYFYYPYMNKVKLMNGQSSDAKLEDTVDSNEQSTSFKNVEFNVIEFMFNYSEFYFSLNYKNAIYFNK